MTLPDSEIDSRYARATHRVMELVGCGVDVKRACYQAHSEIGLGLNQYGRLLTEAEELYGATKLQAAE
jgi:hypothetical protein